MERDWPPPPLTSIDINGGRMTTNSTYFNYFHTPLPVILMARVAMLLFFIIYKGVKASWTSKERVMSEWVATHKIHLNGEWMCDHLYETSFYVTPSQRICCFRHFRIHWLEFKAFLVVRSLHLYNGLPSCFGVHLGRDGSSLAAPGQLLTALGQLLAAIGQKQNAMIALC